MYCPSPAIGRSDKLPSSSIRAGYFPVTAVGATRDSRPSPDGSSPL